MFFVLLMTLALGVKTNDDEPYIVYGNKATSERSLPLCAGPREACNVVRQRFWLPEIVHRMCKCTDRTVCPTDFTDLSDRRTIAFNARAQLKFCSQVGELERCSKDTVAAAVGSDGTIHVHCYCGPYHFYQRIHNNASGQYYKCEPYGHCKTGEFCGYITTDSYETYHTCTCPIKHICVLKDRNKIFTEEFLYKGLAYRGICIPRN